VQSQSNNDRAFVQDHVLTPPPSQSPYPPPPQSNVQPTFTSSQFPQPPRSNVPTLPASQSSYPHSNVQQHFPTSSQFPQPPRSNVPAPQSPYPHPPHLNVQQHFPTPTSAQFPYLGSPQQNIQRRFPVSNSSPLSLPQNSQHLSTSNPSTANVEGVATENFCEADTRDARVNNEHEECGEGEGEEEEEGNEDTDTDNDGFDVDVNETSGMSPILSDEISTEEQHIDM
jgi:hypothetical protein